MTEVVRKQIYPGERYIKILLMDDYGTGEWVNVSTGEDPTTIAATVETVINDKIAEMDGRVAAMESTAAALNIDLSAQKVAGQAKKDEFRIGT